MPRNCCKCKRSGQCINCKCSKEGRPCDNCLPSRLNHCKNKQSAFSQSSAAVTLISRSPATSTDTPSSSGRLVNDTSASDNIPFGSDSVSSVLDKLADLPLVSNQSHTHSPPVCPSSQSECGTHTTSVHPLSQNECYTHPPPAHPLMSQNENCTHPPSVHPSSHYECYTHPSPVYPSFQRECCTHPPPVSNQSHTHSPPVCPSSQSECCTHTTPVHPLSQNECCTHPPPVSNQSHTHSPPVCPSSQSECCTHTTPVHPLSQNENCTHPPPIHPSSQKECCTRPPSIHPSSQNERCNDFNDAFNLPPYPSANPCNQFTWGENSGEKIAADIDYVYSQIVHWRQNVFKIPSDKQGKVFVQEMARLFNAYGEASAMEGVAMKAAMIFPALILQKPFKTSKSKDHVSCMERRMNDWREGKFIPLLKEGTTIQHRLISTHCHQSQRSSDTMARKFAELMMKGKVKKACRLMTKDGSYAPLPLNQMIDGRSVHDILHEKHPHARPLHTSALLQQELESQAPFHPLIFEEIDGLCILKAALKAGGGAGPSGLDASLWRRMCCSFQGASSDLCAAIARTAKRICSSPVDPEPLQPLLASRLIALDKCPGVRPIGIGEVPRRIIGKAILNIINTDIQESVGIHQLCVGQQYGCEAAVHALETILEGEDNEGILLVDASNAFNNLNRRATLMNVQKTCPAFANILINTYRAAPALYINGETILSNEGTTQGDPLAMAMYAIGTLPLIHHLKEECKQIWYADDSSAGGSLNNLHNWWEKLLKLGPAFGYFVNPSKSVLIVKDDLIDEARKVFKGSNIQLTSSGGKYLGSSIGSCSFKEAFVKEKVRLWKTELEKLAQFANSQPQAAYSALTHSLQLKWSYLLRSTRDISSLFQPIEDVLRHKIIPAITGEQNISDAERALFALPTRMGGLGIRNPTEIAGQEFLNSTTVTKTLVHSILGEANFNLIETKTEQEAVRKSVHQTNKKAKEEKLEETLKSLSDTTQRAVSLAQEKGASSWINTLPIEDHGFALHKGAFRDGSPRVWQQFVPVARTTTSSMLSTARWEDFPYTDTTTSGI